MNPHLSVEEAMAIMGVGAPLGSVPVTLETQPCGQPALWIHAIPQIGPEQGINVNSITRPNYQPGLGR